MYFISVFWSCASLMQVTSIFWAAAQPLPRAERATIPHMKEEMQGFHMSPIAEILVKYPCFQPCLSLNMEALIFLRTFKRKHTSVLATFWHFSGGCPNSNATTCPNLSQIARSFDPRNDGT